MSERDRDLDGWAGDAVNPDAGDPREELAQARTAMAEDRTVLANERTFASWMRTGLAAVGIGLGFHALFLRMEPWWVPRAIATAFFLVGIFVTASAERRACSVTERLHAHKVETVGVARLRWITLVTSLAIAALIAAVWLLPV
jgi:putative membrane protein